MSSNTRSAIIGGVAGALIGVALQVLQHTANLDFLGYVFCFSFVSCGLVAVWHLTNEEPVTLTGGEGVKLGAFAGVIAGALTAALSWLLTAAGVFPSKEEALGEALAEAAAGGEAAIEFTTWLMDFLYGIGGIVFVLVIATLMGLVGGAIGRAIWKTGEEA